MGLNGLERNKTFIRVSIYGERTFPHEKTLAISELFTKHLRTNQL